MKLLGNDCEFSSSCTAWIAFNTHNSSSLTSISNILKSELPLLSLQKLLYLDMINHDLDSFTVRLQIQKDKILRGFSPPNNPTSCFDLDTLKMITWQVLVLIGRLYLFNEVANVEVRLDRHIDRLIMSISSILFDLWRIHPSLLFVEYWEVILNFLGLMTTSLSLWE